MTTGGKLWSWRYLILRRVTQAGVLLLLWGTFRLGWTLAGEPLLRGNLSASEAMGTVPLADPFAVLQIVAGGRLIDIRVLVGALIVVAFYAVVGGRAFCSWVCPVNPLTDLAAWVRRRLGIRGSLRLGRGARRWILGLALVLSALTGVAAFEWISPIGMLQRGLLFGIGAGWIFVGGLFLFDLLLLRHGWCGHLCPLGAFYGLLGSTAQLRVAFDDASCTRCGDCVAVCPEPQVFDFKRAARAGMIVSGDCSNCGRCTPICPEGSLRFDWRRRIRAAQRPISSQRARRAS